MPHKKKKGCCTEKKKKKEKRKEIISVRVRAKKKERDFSHFSLAVRHTQ